MVLAIVCITGCNRQAGQAAGEKEIESKKKETVGDPKLLEGLQAFAASHNAVTGWLRQVSRSEFDKVYSAEIVDVLVRSDGRPVLLYCEIGDVHKDGNEYRVYGSAHLNWNTKLDLVLRADSDPAARIIRMRPGDFESIAVVVKFDRIGRSRDVETISENDDTGGSTTDSTAHIRATGQLIDVSSIKLESLSDWPL
jgi:hypothetical protein